MRHRESSAASSACALASLGTIPIYPYPCSSVVAGEAAAAAPWKLTETRDYAGPHDGAGATSYGLFLVEGLVVRDIRIYFDTRMTVARLGEGSV